jgi:hypothetical protein
MHTRKASGATLALVAAAAVIIILVGVGIFFLMQIFGGFRELQNATDAGNLNVAKQALKLPHYTVNDTYELDFTGLVDGDNGMDLLVYNRSVGQAFLVGMNAMADRGDSGMPNVDGLKNARVVANAANGGDPGDSTNQGAGQQLYKMFSSHASNELFGKFDYLAQKNAARMLGAKDGDKIQQTTSDYDIAFMEAKGPTNVYLAGDLLPYIGDTRGRITPPTESKSAANNKDGNPYLAGYVDIPLGAAGVTWNLVGVPVFPGNQPHHVSSRDFYAAKSANDAKFQGVVPPNAFKSVTKADNKSTNGAATMEAYSIVGVMSQDFPVSVPNGYIEVYNPAGVGGNRVYDPTEDVRANQLMNGIFTGKTNSGLTAFSTDANAIQDWQNFNQDPDAWKAAHPGQNQPASKDTAGNELINFTDPADPSGKLVRAEPSEISASDSSPCKFFDLSPETAVNPKCMPLSNAFDNAYSNQEKFTSDPNQLMAVEKLKASILENFNARTTISCPGPVNGEPGTGLRYWEHNGQGGRNVSHDGAGHATHGSSMMSRPGTILELIDQINPAFEDDVLRQVGQRMHEIDPNTSEAAAIAWIRGMPGDAGHTLQLDSYHYIWFDKTSRSWQFTSNNDAPPPGFRLIARQHRKPDGSRQRYNSDPGTGYATIQTIVDPKFENGIHDQYYTRPPGQEVSRGMDTVDWTPSSGYGNMLGQLSFHNFCGGAEAGNSPPGGFYTAPD